MLWYSVGLKEDFDSAYQQEFDSNFSKIAPYASLVTPAGTASIKKTFPSTCMEIWLAFNSNWTTSYATSRSFVLCDVSGNVLFGIYDNMLRLYLSGTFMVELSTLGLSDTSSYRREIHYKRSANSVSVEIWQEDVLIYSYTGPTGAGTSPVSFMNAYTSGVTSKLRMWDFVASDTGRVKGYKPVVVVLSGPGEKNTANVIEYAGNYTAATNGGMGTNITTIVNAAPAVPGKIKEIVATFLAAGTAYLGVVTRNASDATKYTIKYVSGAITVAAAETTFASGVDFATTEDWVLTANDRIAIYCTDSSVLAYYSSGANTGYTYPGNSMSDATEKTFTANSNKPCLRMRYQADDSTRAYMITDATSELNYNEYEEGNHLLELDNPGDGVLVNINSMPKAAIYVKSVRVTARGKTGSNLTTANFRLKIGSDDLTKNVALPASQSQVYAQFDNGTWSVSDFNAAQVGLDAEA